MRQGASADPVDREVEIACVAFGVPFGLRLATADLRQAALARLPHATAFKDEMPQDAMTFSLLRTADGRGFRSLAGQDLTAESLNADVVADQMGRDLMVHVANYAPDRVFVHAGVVGWQGRAILLPGPSFAGKTTLTAALVREGAVYYSDEYAVLDESGAVHPYARDLQMRQPGRPEQQGLAVAALNGVAGTEPLRARAVVFAQYRPGARWLLTPMTPGMGVLEMLRHTIPVQRTPARVMAALAAAVSSATVWTTERDEAGEAARALLGAFR